ncbi:hypothetical protein IE81DRAFT_366950 [Ceraceosorus guamensis]|uniref:Zn(2)-C6 fungal-type domain-containing protein n=1 Tax=Ceraceosorus guamensis TaxID=1522189 RepID=A0A316VXM5_9BASI|nr:hypothetical protein IE81DRAFT_366950 [Ceraceosorus guamensis]PWN42064.1 hypothetical protein IE81DRAFT_366950 [Ceraceosorus guamensis]
MQPLKSEDFPAEPVSEHLDPPHQEILYAPSEEVQEMNQAQHNDHLYYSQVQAVDGYEDSGAVDGAEGVVGQHAEDLTHVAAFREHEGLNGEEEGALYHNESQQDGLSDSKARGSNNGAHAPKRRKINTCLPCKRRKVKCDKQRPHCGQCKKHHIEEPDCVWSLDADHNAAPADAHAAPISGTNTAYDSTWYSAQDGSAPELAQQAVAQHPWDQGEAARIDSSEEASGASKAEDVPAMLERIRALESELARTTTRLLGQDSANETELSSKKRAGSEDLAAAASAERQDIDTEELTHMETQLNQLRKLPPSSASMYEANTGLAAGALAMIARNHPHASMTNGTGKGRGANMSTWGVQGPPGGRFPFQARLTTELVKEALDLLPEDSTVDHIIAADRAVHMSGLSTGTSYRLVDLQLGVMRAEINRWDGGKCGSDLPCIDLTFLALLFAILSAGIEYSEPTTLVYHKLVDRLEDIPEKTCAYVAMSQTLMSVCDMLERPNLNLVMALAEIRMYQVAHARFIECSMCVSMMIRMSLFLRLHRMGSAYDDQAKWMSEEQTPSVVTGWEDQPYLMGQVLIPLYPQGKPDPEAITVKIPQRSHLVREAARRTFRSIVLVSYFMSEQYDRHAQIDPHTYNTTPPINVDEEELPMGDEVERAWELPIEKARGVPTENSLFPFTCAVAHLAWEGTDAVARDKMDYAKVLDLDSKCRKVLEDLPDFLRLDGESENLEHVQLALAQRPHLASQRFIIIETVHFRLLMLHRPYMLRGYRDPTYEPSVKVSVESARTIIFCRSEMDRISWAIQKYPAFRIHNHMSAMLLAVHLLEEARQGRHSDPESIAIREEVTVALNFVAGRTTSDGTPITKSGAKAAKATRRMIDALLSESAARGEVENDESSLAQQVATIAGHDATQNEADFPSTAALDSHTYAVPESRHTLEELPEVQRPFGSEAFSASVPTNSTNTSPGSLLDALLRPDDPVNLYLSQLFGSSTGENLPPPPPENFWGATDKVIRLSEHP